MNVISVTGKASGRNIQEYVSDEVSPQPKRQRLSREECDADEASPQVKRQRLSLEEFDDDGDSHQVKKQHLSKKECNIKAAPQERG